MIRSKVSFALVLWLLSGCMKVKSKESTPVEESPVSTSQTKGVKYQFIPGAEPNQYKIKFTFEGSRSSVFVVKSSTSHKSTQMAALINQNWEDDQVQAGQEITYEFGDYNPQEFKSWNHLTIKVPEDWVVDHVVDLADRENLKFFSNREGQLLLSKYRRIYLLKGSTLILRNYNVKVETEEIHSDFGLIQTFPLNSKAVDGEGGRSGGFIELQANLAAGVLRLDLRGEDGGDGLKGARPDTSMKGAKGEKGQPGVGRLVQHEFLSTIECIKEPGRGGPGFPGSAGRIGQDGRSGGNSGQFLLRVKEGKDFTLQDSKNPGRGGSGGMGGDGGEGGDGGDPGGFDISGGLPTCALLKGETGPRGPQGPAGQRGSDGVAEAVCEIRDSQNKVCH